MNKRYAFLIFVVLMMMVSGCAQKPATTEDDSPELITDLSGLYGIWQPVSSTQTWREYREDGTFRVAGTRDSLEETPLVTGEYWYEENVLYFKEVSADPEWACGGEDIGQYEVQTLANGEIKFIKVKDGCLERASALSNATYKKVEE